MVVQNSQLTGSSHWILTSLTFRGWQLAQRWRSESCKVGRHGEIQILMDILILQSVKEAAQISQMYSPLLLPLFYQHWPKVKIQKICKQGKLRSYLDAEKTDTKGTCVLRMRWEEKSGHRCVQWPSLEERIVISWNDSCRSYGKHPINEVQRIWGRLLEVSKPNSSRIWENMRRCKYVNIWN